MNRIERMLEEVEAKLCRNVTNKFLFDTYAKQVGFFKWLLDEATDAPTYELHQKSVSPSVWGIGDVSYHISVQLQKIQTPARPIILVFDYQSLESTAKMEEK